MSMQVKITATMLMKIKRKTNKIKLKTDHQEKKNGYTPFLERPPRNEYEK